MPTPAKKRVGSSLLSPVRAPSADPQPKYISPQFSIAMEYVFNPIYEFIAKFFPQWWSPNGITLFGITCTLLASVLFFTDVVWFATNDPKTHLPITSAGYDTLYDIRPTSTAAFFSGTGQQYNNSAARMTLPAKMVHSSGALPKGSFVSATITDDSRFYFILAGVLKLIYIIADNTDGKHARRYKKSSSIGEYLDHGLDMISALLSCFVVGAAAGERLSIGFPLQLGAGMMMVFSHFHNYDKHEFIWGDRLFSVDEAMVLIAVYPLLVGLFPSLQNLLLFGTNIRFVQVLVFVFVIAMFFNCLGFIRRNRNTVNPLLGFAIFAFASMVGWSVYHQGGMLGAVQDEMKRFLDCFGPYLGWAKDHEVSASFTFPDSGGKGAPTRAAMYLYSLMLKMCPPYMLRVVGSRFLKLFTCYPALWSITMACVLSIIVHIPIAGKCLKVKELSYIPLAGVLATLFLFGVSPIIGTGFGILWHLAQILINCTALQRRAYLLSKKQ